jgi:hypothetical protein
VLWLHLWQRLCSWQDVLPGILVLFAFLRNITERLFALASQGI